MTTEYSGAPGDQTDVVHVQIDPADLLGRPGDKINMIAGELAKGHRVELSPTKVGQAEPRRGPSKEALDRATTIVTVLSGGLAFGAASVAIAPASLIAAAVAAAVGVVVAAIGSRFDEKHSRKATNTG